MPATSSFPRVVVDPSRDTASDPPKGSVRLSRNSSLKMTPTSQNPTARIREALGDDRALPGDDQSNGHHGARRLGRGLCRGPD